MTHEVIRMPAPCRHLHTPEPAGAGRFDIYLFVHKGLRWLAPAPLLSGMRAGMPPEAFQGVLGALQPHVDTKSWGKLMAALTPAAQAA